MTKPFDHLELLRDWLVSEEVTEVAMEATAVLLCQLLEVGLLRSSLVPGPVIGMANGRMRA